MDITKTLYLRFGTMEGDPWNLSIRDPKEGVTANEVETAMNALVANPVFNSLVGGSVESAEIVVRQVTDLF